MTSFSLWNDKERIVVYCAVGLMFYLLPFGHTHRDMTATMSVRPIVLSALGHEQTLMAGIG